MVRHMDKMLTVERLLLAACVCVEWHHACGMLRIRNANIFETRVDGQHVFGN